MIHRLTYRRTNHGNLHVRGYKEEGAITTPFDMAVLNDLDRFHLTYDVIDRFAELGESAAYLKREMRDTLLEHGGRYIGEPRTGHAAGADLAVGGDARRSRA